MATIKHLKRKKGEAYQISYTHPKSKRWVRKTIYCSLKDAEIIKKHKGDIKVESKVGEGTTFTIQIPLVI